jgi:hypothetical protein
MSDIVERLRKSGGDYHREKMYDEAADKIEAQQDTISQLREELAEARAFIVEEYKRFHSYHPWAVEARTKYPWLEQAEQEEEKR